MSDILSSIDDTLADWNGSADSARWRPDGDDQPVTPAGYVQALCGILGQTTSTSLPERDVWEWRLDPDVWPHRDYVLDLHGVALPPGVVVRVDGVAEAELLRIIEGPLFGPWRVRPVPERPKRLDARYHQRQKNRRKHRQ